MTSDDTNSQFDLFDHKGLVVQLLLIALAGGYLLFDWVALTSYQAVGSMPLLPFLLAGAVAAVLATALGNGAPITERLGVGALLVALLCASTYPAMMRYTLWQDDTPQSIKYTIVEPGLFEHPDHPTIDLRDQPLTGYWNSYPPGSEFGFTLYQSTDDMAVVALGPAYTRTGFTRGFNQPR